MKIEEGNYVFPKTDKWIVRVGNVRKNCWESENLALPTMKAYESFLAREVTFCIKNKTVTLTHWVSSDAADVRELMLLGKENEYGDKLFVFDVEVAMLNPNQENDLITFKFKECDLYHVDPMVVSYGTDGANLAMTSYFSAKEVEIL
jgi:hypothetical protein